MYHEKPIYGGFESRVSLDRMLETETYFLKMFHKYANTDDIIKQDLAIHGLSIFDYFDIKYLTFDKDAALGTPKVQEVQLLMSEILNENVKMIVYKIPKPDSSEPFLLLGSGWHDFKECGERMHESYECDTRSSMKNSEILIVNPTNTEKEIILNLTLSAVKNEKTMVISVNNEKLNAVNIPPTPINLSVENLILKPGVNVVMIDTDEFISVEYGLTGTETGKGIKTMVSFHVRSISITIQP